MYQSVPSLIISPPLANSRGIFLKGQIPHPPGHKESEKPWPQGQKNRASLAKRYWNANMFKNIKTKKSQSFLVGGFYGCSKYSYVIRCLLLKYRLIFFTSLDSIWRAFRRVKYRKTSKNISQYFKRRHLIIYLLSNSKNFTPGVKFWSSNLTGDIKILQKVKFTRITRIKTFLEGTNSGGVKFFGLRKC